MLLLLIIIVIIINYSKKCKYMHYFYR